MPEQTNEQQVEEQIICECCSNPIEGESKSTLDGEVCQECYDDNYFRCEDCGEIIHNDNQCEDKGGNFICQDCFDDNYFICYNCGSTECNDDGYNDNDGNSICTTCYDDNYFTCNNCDNVFHNDDSCWSEENDEYYCSDCFESCEMGHYIHNYGYKPSPIFNFSAKDENNNLTRFFGFELEVKNNNRIKDVSENLYNWINENIGENRLYFKEDGSIDHGFEIVSHPYTLNAIKENKFKQFFNKLNDLEFFVDSACGLHIHTNRNNLLKDDINKMAIFFSKNKEMIEKLSQRVSFSYCKIKEYNICNLEDYNNSENRNCAINNQPNYTVEFRIFASTLDYDDFISYIKFLDELIKFVQETDKRFMDWGIFIEWLEGNDKDSDLIEYLKQI